jgi:hypothetical protein
MVTGSFLICKRVMVNSKWVNLYLSCSGKWIKSKGNAQVMDKTEAEKSACENQAFAKQIFFNN